MAWDCEVYLGFIWGMLYTMNNLMVIWLIGLLNDWLIDKLKAAFAAENGSLAKTEDWMYKYLWLHATDSIHYRQFGKEIIQLCPVVMKHLQTFCHFYQIIVTVICTFCRIGVDFYFLSQDNLSVHNCNVFCNNWLLFRYCWKNV